MLAELPQPATPGPQVLYTREQVLRRVAELAAGIEQAGSLSNTTALVVLRGAVPFAVDLLRALRTDLPAEYCMASSYRTGTQREAVTHVEVFGNPILRGRNILLIEDIVDTGHTLQALRAQLVAKWQPASIRTVALLDKPGRREVDVTPDHTGFTVGADQFIVGYGMDFSGAYRNLPYLAMVSF